MHVTLLLLCLFLPLFAETNEVFTLQDGRQLVGTYQADRQQILIAGPIAAGIRVVPTAIVDRRPATDADIPVAKVHDPDQARSSRSAWLRTAIRGIDDAIHERATHRISIERRLATNRDKQVRLAQELAVTNQFMADLVHERQRLRALIDEVEQVRALTELRIVTSTVHVERDAQQHSTIASLTISELTLELTAATHRLEQLHKTAATNKCAIAHYRSIGAGLHERLGHLSRSIATDESRLAGYDAVDATAMAERQRLLEVQSTVSAETTTE